MGIVLVPVFLIKGALNFFFISRCHWFFSLSGSSGEITDSFLYVCTIKVLLSRHQNSFFEIIQWNILNSNPNLFPWICPFYFQMFTILFFYCKELTVLSFSISLFSFNLNVVIFGNSFFFFLQNIRITIITSNSQVIKIHFFYINFSSGLLSIVLPLNQKYLILCFPHICFQLNININKIIILSVFWLSILLSNSGFSIWYLL